MCLGDSLAVWTRLRGKPRIMRKRGRPPRLPPEAYRGNRTGSFTANVVGRKCIFVEPEIVDLHIAFLRRSCEEYGCICLLYCFMPDHSHLLLRGLDEASDMRLAIIKFKVLSGIWLRNNGFPKFQEDFHDRVLRYGELRNHAKYIAMNPVRANLVESFVDYPFLGSMVGTPIEVLWSIGDSEEFG